MQLVALDLEGSGAQDRDDEAVLEIAVVPIRDGLPDMAAAWCTLVNPQRPVPARPWISPGLTDDVLTAAPTLPQVEPDLARLIDGAYVMGHNIDVDWRLLHQHCPSLAPAGLIDTSRLARTVDPTVRNGLAALVDRLGLTERVGALAATSFPHRALWDATAVALLAPVLVRARYGEQAEACDLLREAGIPVGHPGPAPRHPSRFDAGPESR